MPADFALHPNDVEPLAVLAATSSKTLAIILWSGLGLLTVALILLMRTRWGNARTVTKCVWLSMFAHFLLGGLAYGTKLFFQIPPSTQSDVVRIQIVLDSGDDPEADGPNEDKDSLSDELASSDPAENVDSIDDDLNVDVPPPNDVMEPSENDIPPAAPDLLSPTIKPETQTPIAVESPNPDPQSPPESNAEPNDALVADRASELANDDSQSQPPVQPGAPSNQDNLVAVTEVIDGDHATPEFDVDPEESLQPAASPKFVPSVATQTAPGQEHSAETPRDLAAPTTTVKPNYVVPALCSLRNPSKRLENALARGGSQQTEQAVEQALRWLAEMQQDDGHWDPAATGAGREDYVLGQDRQGAGRQADTALTGLALLAFLGAGQTHLEGDFRQTVARGLTFLMQSQDPSGHLAGHAELFAHMYSHGIATLAVSDALVLTGDRSLLPCVERAIAYSINAQDPQTGSWRYMPRESGDMSQFGWQIMALRSAHSAGVAIPPESIQRANRFIQLCSSGRYGGLASYRPGQPPSETMTAESLACRYFVGQSVPESIAGEAADYIARQPPGSGDVNYYLWYYGTLAMFQSGSGHWSNWNESLQRQLLQTQITSGSNRGAWPANGKWSGYGGQVYSTAMGTLCLEVYYRYAQFNRIRVADANPEEKQDWLR